MPDPTPVELLSFIKETFDSEELKTLCFQLYVQFDDLAGQTREAKARELIEYMQRRGRLPALTAALARERPEHYRAAYGDPVKRPVKSRIYARNPLQVFISHAHQDAKFANRLANDLRREHYEVWIAPDSIAIGERWVDAINRALRESSIFLLVSTPAAVDSEWVQDETNYAIELSKSRQVRFIRLNVREADVPPLWSIRQHVSFRPYKRGLQTLLTALQPPALEPSEQPVKRPEMSVDDMLPNSPIVATAQNSEPTHVDKPSNKGTPIIVSKTVEAEAIVDQAHDRSEAITEPVESAKTPKSVSRKLHKQQEFSVQVSLIPVENSSSTSPLPIAVGDETTEPDLESPAEKALMIRPEVSQLDAVPELVVTDQGARRITHDIDEGHFDVMSEQVQPADRETAAAEKTRNVLAEAVSEQEPDGVRSHPVHRSRGKILGWAGAVVLITLLVWMLINFRDLSGGGSETRTPPGTESISIVASEIPLSTSTVGAGATIGSATQHFSTAVTNVPATTETRDHSNTLTSTQKPMTAIATTRPTNAPTRTIAPTNIPIPSVNAPIVTVAIGTTPSSIPSDAIIYYPDVKTYFELIGPLTEQNKLLTVNDGNPAILKNTNLYPTPYILPKGTSVYFFAAIEVPDPVTYANCANSCFGRLTLYRNGEKVLDNAPLWDYHPWAHGAYFYTFEQAGVYSALVYFCDVKKYACLEGAGWQAFPSVRIDITES